jgi:hypothetical protein
MCMIIPALVVSAADAGLHRRIGQAVCMEALARRGWENASGGFDDVLLRIGQSTVTSSPHR